MFAVRKIFSRIQIPLCRFYSRPIRIIYNNPDIPKIMMSNQPVNSLDKVLLERLKMSLMNAQENRYTGVILTSGLKEIFSAGLDIMEMYNRTEKQLREYWTTLQDTWLTLYNLEMPVAAAINGSCLAGGCLLAMSCEYRVLVEGHYAIGLNETQLGLAAPEWFKNLYIETLGYRKAELALLQGTLFQPKEALQIGLVDEVVPDHTTAIIRCRNYIESFKNIPYKGRQKTKMELRKRNSLWLKNNKEADVDEFVTFIQLPEVQESLGLYVDKLKNKNIS